MKKQPRQRGGLVLAVLAVLWQLAGAVQAAPALHSPHPQETSTSLNVQAFLDGQPGVLKTYQDQGQPASAIIEGHSFYYGINPYLHLVLLETTSHLLSDPNPPDAVLRQPYSLEGPDGFTDQVAWASRELRAGLGPYDKPPVLTFTDGVKMKLTLDQAPEGVAIQRFLAIGRTSDEWKALNERFKQVFADYFSGTLPEPGPALSDQEPPESGFLQCPWPIGMKAVHLAYFDHVYPTVDSGGDGNNVTVTYVGPADVQYNTHDGHDYYFPDNPVGTPILAAADGIAYARTARGNGVYMLHPGGYETVYWHLNHFAPRFRELVDSPQGVWVEAGEVLGTSGTSGFTYGAPHLHFEVRYHGKQVDPYGWHGDGEDPCNEYAGCIDRGWLWHSDLYGLYDFTPPDYAEGGYAQASNSAEPIVPDQSPPIGTFSINPPEDLLFLSHFDGHILQQVGKGQPTTHGDVAFEAGRYGQALALPEGSSLSYPLRENLRLEAGTLSLWVRIPNSYPDSSTGSHYLLAASASLDSPDPAPPGTMAFRRELSSTDGTPLWNFWTTTQTGAATRDDLTVPDTFDPGWHHIALTWEQAQSGAPGGSKAVFFDGVPMASTSGISLPVDIGEMLHLGRFRDESNQSGFLFDELALFGRVLAQEEIAHLAHAPAAVQSSTSVLTTTSLLLDTNAVDDEGVIVAVQLGHDGIFEDPQPYYDSFRWNLPLREGAHTLAVRYFDRASNRRVVSQTVRLALPPQGTLALQEDDGIRATLALSATDTQPPIDMQLSQSASFASAEWEPLRTTVSWIWQRVEGEEAQPGEPAPGRTLYVRFRDAAGIISEPILLEVPTIRTRAVYLPMVIR